MTLWWGNQLKKKHFKIKGKNRSFILNYIIGMLIMKMWSRMNQLMMASHHDCTLYDHRQTTKTYLLPILARQKKNWQLFIHNTTMHMNNLYCQFIKHANSTYLENMIHNVYWSVPHILLEISAIQVLKINFLSN
jgi:hypothetical protein